MPRTERDHLQELMDAVADWTIEGFRIAPCDDGTFSWFLFAGKPEGADYGTRCPDRATAMREAADAVLAMQAAPEFDVAEVARKMAEGLLALQEAAKRIGDALRKVDLA